MEKVPVHAHRGVCRSLRRKTMIWGHVCFEVAAWSGHLFIAKGGEVWNLNILLAAIARFDDALELLDKIRSARSTEESLMLQAVGHGSHHRVDLAGVGFPKWESTVQALIGEPKISRRSWNPIIESRYSVFLRRW